MNAPHRPIWMIWAVGVVCGTGCIGDPPQLPPPPETTEASTGDGTGSGGTGVAPETSGVDTSDGPADSGSTTTDQPGQTTGIEMPPAGDCCISSSVPGCNNNDVAECVCQSEPVCCDVEWADNCVTLVDELGCGGCGVVVNECCEAHAECENPETYECVCSFDSFCCDGDWDFHCVVIAAVYCGVPCKEPMASCCEAGDQFGCENFEVTNCVCESSPECCLRPWGDSCANLALDCGATCDGALPGG